MAGVAAARTASWRRAGSRRSTRPEKGWSTVGRGRKTRTRRDGILSSCSCFVRSGRFDFEDSPPGGASYRPDSNGSTVFVDLFFRKGKKSKSRRWGRWRGVLRCGPELVLICYYKAERAKSRNERTQPHNTPSGSSYLFSFVRLAQ